MALFSLGYVLFIGLARLTADRQIAFDDRMLVPVALLLGIAACSCLDLWRRGWRRSLLILVLSMWILFLGVRSKFFIVGREHSTEVLKEMESTPSDCTIYSNYPDRVVYDAHRPVKLTPSERDKSRLAEFKERLLSGPPSLLILYPDGWYGTIPRAELLRALDLQEPDHVDTMIIKKF